MIHNAYFWPGCAEKLQHHLLTPEKTSNKRVEFDHHLRKVRTSRRTRADFSSKAASRVTLKREAICRKLDQVNDAEVVADARYRIDHLQAELQRKKALLQSIAGGPTLGGTFVEGDAF